MTIVLVFFALHICCVLVQATIQPLATNEDCICSQTDVCSCTFVVEYRVTMVLDKEEKLVYPDKGLLKTYPNDTELTPEQYARVFTADGFGSIPVIAINGRFPGPRVEVYENQELNLTVINRLQTQSITIHFHGQVQYQTPWMDGVPYVTQCPISPGQTFVYKFKASPVGTYFYHSHVGGERGMGLFGPFIVRQTNVAAPPFDEIIITLQDWNHLMNPETAFERARTGQFNLKTGEAIPSTYSVDSAGFERFEFQSGLINGKGRFWNTNTTHNGAPLTRLNVSTGVTYRFRVIGSTTVYPMRVYIQNHNITLYASDGFDLEPIVVQSIIIYPGERYDFLWEATTDQIAKHVLLIAETLESPKSLHFDKYHVAEAVLDFVDIPGPLDPDPVNDKIEDCTIPCITFNCPYMYYPVYENRTCLNFNNATNKDSGRNLVNGNKVHAEYFLNFGFPGTPGNSPGSVNGRKFVVPTSPLITQSKEKFDVCDEELCKQNGICECTHIQNLESNKLIQMTLLNLGKGAGASHPIHVHGHTYHVMKVGLATYNETTGELISNNKDIACTDDFNYCSSANWENNSWSGGNIPGMNAFPPLKDTIIVPTGGYVVIRFVSDNPGFWFMHCHIDMHQMVGMAMVVNESGTWPNPANGFPKCQNFLNERGQEESAASNDHTNAIIGGVVGGVAAVVLIAAVVIVIFMKTCRTVNAGNYERPVAVQMSEWSPQ